MTDDERGRVERVESAIALAFDGTPWDKQPFPWQQHFRKMARAAIAAMREGELGIARAANPTAESKEGEARAAGELDALHDLLSDDASRESVVQAAQRIIRERDEWKQRAEAAESLAKAERSQRESEGVAYRKEIAELRQRLAAADEGIQAAVTALGTYRGSL